MAIPANIKIFHITHLRNLPAIALAGQILSDARRIKAGLQCQLVGMSAIKARRLEEIVVSCHPGTKVGEYAPFYFCPRSVMLYILHRGNHPDVHFKEGQEPIVHLQADLNQAIIWANAKNIRWAFTDGNAGSFVTSYYNSAADLDKINWTAVGQNDFRDSFIKEGKQAEFLMFDSFPWTLIEKIGVINEVRANEVRETLAGRSYIPPIRVETGWYY